MRFSTPRMVPAEVVTPMAVLPSLMASREYSTWKRRPSGETVLMPRSFGALAIWFERGTVSEPTVFRPCNEHGEVAVRCSPPKGKISCEIAAVEGPRASECW